MTQISSKDADPRDIDLGKTLVLLTYTLPPDARRRGYNEWLRQVDNPFFNSIVGIEHYSNWEILESDRVSLPFSHFDLLFVDGPDSLEGVWFNQELEVFRREWMEKWGYGGNETPPANTVAYLASGSAAGEVSVGQLRRFSAHRNKVADGRSLRDLWLVSHLVVKHWAKESDGPWRYPVRESAASWLSAFATEPTDSQVLGEAPHDVDVVSCIARCIAAPSPDPPAR